MKNCRLGVPWNIWYRCHVSRTPKGSGWGKCMFVNSKDRKGENCLTRSIYENQNIVLWTGVHEGGLLGVYFLHWDTSRYSWINYLCTEYFPIWFMSWLGIQKKCNLVSLLRFHIPRVFKQFPPSSGGDFLFIWDRSVKVLVIWWVQLGWRGILILNQQLCKDCLDIGKFRRMFLQCLLCHIIILPMVINQSLYDEDLVIQLVLYFFPHLAPWISSYEG